MKVEKPKEKKKEENGNEKMTSKYLTWENIESMLSWISCQNHLKDFHSWNWDRIKELKILKEHAEQLKKKRWTEDLSEET